MGTCQSNGVYVKSPKTFACNKPQRLSVTLFKFSDVEKFKNIDRKASRSQSYAFDYTQNLKGGNCYDQSFLVSLYLKPEKYDKETFKFVAVKSFEFDRM